MAEGKNIPNNKETHLNKGIVCDVSNCIYNDGDHKCKANQIAVGPSFAISTADTICATFENK